MDGALQAAGDLDRHAKPVGGREEAPPLQAGERAFFCSIPGERRVGQQGVLLTLDEAPIPAGQAHVLGPVHLV